MAPVRSAATLRFCPATPVTSVWANVSKLSEAVPDSVFAPIATVSVRILEANAPFCSTALSARRIRPRTGSAPFLLTTAVAELKRIKLLLPPASKPTSPEPAWSFCVTVSEAPAARSAMLSPAVTPSTTVLPTMALPVTEPTVIAPAVCRPKEPAPALPATLPLIGFRLPRTTLREASARKLSAVITPELWTISPATACNLTVPETAETFPPRAIFSAPAEIVTEELAEATEPEALTVIPPGLTRLPPELSSRPTGSAPLLTTTLPCILMAAPTVIAPLPSRVRLLFASVEPIAAATLIEPAAENVNVELLPKTRSVFAALNSMFPAWVPVEPVVPVVILTLLLLLFRTF